MKDARFTSHLEWVASQQSIMLEHVKAWSAINSGSYHLRGLERMAEVIEQAFSPLQATATLHKLPPMQVVDSRGNLVDKPLGKLLHITKHRPKARLRILLAGHMDTVFPEDHSFQSPRTLDSNTLNGPGVADMKGGIIVMLHALHALERSEWAEHISWEAIINPDEEIGSLGSAAFFADAAPRNDLGLLYEPSMADGTIVSARKGSGNFAAVMRGRAAHAGREPHLGRNAIVALAAFIQRLYALNNAKPGITVNPGKLEGGGPVNVVPDLAICRFNIRVGTLEEQHWIEAEIKALEKEFAAQDGISLQIHGGFTRSPKVMDAAHNALLTLLKDTGQDLGLTILTKPSGGCCDGNNLATHRLPNIDTLGVRGGNIHSADEFLCIDSLTERAQLSALLLMRLAADETLWPHKKGA